MGINCCEASGPRGLFNFPLHIVMQEKSGVRINYFAEGSFVLKTPAGKQLTLIQQTNYPVSGRIDFMVDLPQQENFPITLRIPEWSKRFRIAVNGEWMDTVAVNGLMLLNKTWKKGDRIVLELDMSARIERIAGAVEHIAIVRGPIVLSRDTRLGGPDISAILSPALDKGELTLKPVNTSDTSIWMQFEARFIPESYQEGAAAPISILLCDYASAGNGTVPSLFRVWLPQLLDPRK